MAAQPNQVQLPKVEPLTEGNYGAWSFKMKMYLGELGLWEVVSTEVPIEAEEREIAAWTANGVRALRQIGLSIASDQVVYIQECTEGRQAWLILEEYHQGGSVGTKIRTLKKIFKTNLEVGSDMRCHLNKFLEWFSTMSHLGSPLDEQIKVGAILASLNSRYSAAVSGIETWEEERITIQAVKNILIEEFEKQKGVVVNKQQYAATSGVAHRPYACHRCGELGHFIKECPLNRDSRNVTNGKNKAYDNRQYLPMFSFWDGHNGQQWVIDSGASTHVCRNRSLFSQINLKEETTVVVANGQSVKSKGIGTVIVMLKKGVPITLDNVLWVPEFNCNLLSVGELVRHEATVTFNKSHCHMRMGSEVIALGDYTGQLYTTSEGKFSQQQVKAAKDEEELLCIHQWHRRLAHRNLQDIHLMKREGLKMKSCNCSNDCEQCLKGKMSRKSFPKAATPTKEPLDCVVSDVCGPMQVESLGKKKYFITFVDVHSKYTEVYFIRDRSEVPTKVIEYVERMKTQTGRKPKIFRTDRATEYMGEKLQSYLRREGIKFQCTVGYAPEQNGVAERKNRTLVEAARSMLDGSGFGKRMWEEAINTANYTFNRMVNKKSVMSPYEAMFNEKPRLKQAHEFGCDAYVMIPSEKRRKLDNKSVRMKFVGYDNAAKGYRMMSPSGKVIVSREVHFLDSKKGMRKANQEAAQQKNEVIIQEEPDDFPVIIVPQQQQHIVPGAAAINDNAEDDEEEFESAESEMSAGPESSSSESEEEPAINQPDEPQPRRSTRATRGQLPSRYCCLSNVESSEPSTYAEAIKSSNANEWMSAMKEELKSIEDNETYEMTDLPPGRKAIGSRWVYKTKKNEDGSIARHKARLVAQGFSQKQGIDYDEVFAPVARSVSLRLLLSSAGVNEYIVKHYDVKTAFLNGTLKEEIYMRQPPGFKVGDKVMKLKKSLYGLKQAAHVWNDLLHKSLTSKGCTTSETDKCLYIKKSNNNVIYLLVHVDDMLVSSNSEEAIDELMNSVGKDFELKDLGEVKHYLGIDMKRDESGQFTISQPCYIDEIVEAAGQSNAKTSKYPVDTGYYKIEGQELPSNEEYRRLIGMLLYLSINTRPDISAAVSILSQKVEKPRDVDMNEVKRITKYLKGTRDLQLQMSTADKKDDMFAYSDANWAENREDRKSNSGYYCSINGGAISWSCRKQTSVALSSCEAEYIALSETCKEVEWLKRVAKDMDIKVADNSLVFTDSQSAIAMVQNQKFSNRTKHIDTRYRYVQDQVNRGEIHLEYHQTDTNIADMMTKPLGGVKIKALRELAGLREMKFDYATKEEC